jgi:hypothetical protein
MSINCNDLNCMLNMQGKCHAERCQKKIDYSGLIGVSVNTYWKKKLSELRAKYNQDEKKKIEISELVSIINKSKEKLKSLEDLNYINLLQKFYSTSIENEIKYYSNVIRTCNQLIEERSKKVR